MKVRCLVLLLLTAMTLPAQTKPASQHEFATFGGGCFWCMEAVFQHVPGVIHSVSGYSGGRTDNPTYEEICEHGTGHAEVIQLEFDPAVISYEKVLETFFDPHHPPTPHPPHPTEATHYR